MRVEDIVCKACESPSVWSPMQKKKEEEENTKHPPEKKEERKETYLLF